MTQATPTIGASQSGLQYRNADNDGKKALLNHHKGSSAPSYAEAGIIWLDDTATPWILKIYDGADWVTVASVNATTNAVEAYHGTAPLRVLNYATDSGAANAYVVAPVPAITAYATGQIVSLKPAAANTTASTLAVSGLTAKNIKMLDGTNPPAGAIATSAVHHLVYDGTNFVLLNSAIVPLAGGGTGATTAAGARTSLGLGTSATLNVGTSASEIVQLTAAAKLPAVDGSLLTNLPGGGYVSPGYVTNRYYSGLLYGADGSSQSVTADRLYILPLMLGAAATFTRVGITVSSSVGSSNARLGLYNMANGVPTTLIADFGTVSTASTGDKEITISQALSPGCYALVSVFSHAPTVGRMTVSSSDAGNIANGFWGGGSSSAGNYISAYQAFTYGALASPFSGSLTYTNSSTAPFIWLRVV